MQSKYIRVLFIGANLWPFAMAACTFAVYSVKSGAAAYTTISPAAAFALVASYFAGIVVLILTLSTMLKRRGTKHHFGIAMALALILGFAEGLCALCCTCTTLIDLTGFGS